MNKKYTILDMQHIASQHRGACLSTKYVNSQTKLKWECSLGHQWESRSSVVVRGHWCAKCAAKQKGDKYRHSLKDMQDLAQQRGGKCLSKKYIDSRQYLLWKCSNGHTWKAPAHRINIGRWCPHCKYNFTEEKCRFIIESLTNNKFPSKKALPNRYILDGYCEALKLAFEYHGEQHYKVIPYFQKTVSLEQRRRMDSHKQELCTNLGIKLIEIPYWEAKLGDNNLVEFIRNNLPLETYKSPNMKQFYKHFSPLKRLKEIAQKRGGACLSNEYINSKAMMKWQCSQEHQWEAAANHIMRGTWCKKCSNRKTIHDMQNLAKLRGGECLSENYETAHIHLEWKCSQGHMWLAKPNNIQQRRWCPKCGAKR